METSNYVDAFHVQKALMIFTGLWPRKDAGILYIVHGFVTSFVLQAAFMMPSLATVFSESADIITVTFTLFITLTVFTYCVKVIIVYAKRNTFYEILEDLEQTLFKDYNPQLDGYMKKAIWIANTTRKLLQYPCIFIVLFLAAFPVFDNSATTRPLPLYMPIDINNLPFPLYVVIYVLEIVASAACACNNANIDSLACSFMALGSVQLQILRNNLRTSALNYGTLSGDVNNYGKYDEEVTENLRKCVEHHNAIAEYVKKLEQTFTFIFLAQFLTSVIVICLTGFGFLVIPVTNMMFAASVAYFSAVICEICIYCIFGDELMAQSLKISDACYMAEWDQCGPEIRKTLFIIMERSKRPFVLTAGKFTILSRDSLVTIFKSSVSYFAVLRKLYGDNE